MDDPERPFSISLIIATRGRVATLAPRLPLWTGSGFDEVIVVDGSYDTEHRRQIRELCESIGAVWLPAPVRFRDTRSLSRNLGARRAKGTWILFRDDDSPVLQSINKGALGKAAAGRDWLVNADAQIITLHRRDAFLAFGGYPEDMVHAEDSIMSNRARGHGVGGREPAWYEGVVTFPPPPEDPISRARNAFWYGYTFLLFLMRTPLREQVVVGRGWPHCARSRITGGKESVPTRPHEADGFEQQVAYRPRRAGPPALPLRLAVVGRRFVG